MKARLNPRVVVLLFVCFALAGCAVHVDSDLDGGGLGCKSGSAIASSDETDPDTAVSLTDDDLALPAEAALTDSIKASIIENLTTPDDVFGYKIEPRWTDVDLDTVTIGLPIAYYYIDKNEVGEYAFTSGEVYQLYPLYIDGRLDCLVQHSEMIDLDAVYDYDTVQMPNDHF